MNNKKFKKNIGLILPIIFLNIISLINMYYAKYISSLYNGLFLKQVLWIIIGFVLMFLVYSINIKYFLKWNKIFYIIGIIFLGLVLITGTKINGSSAWFTFKNIRVQPSEIFKFFYIITLSYIATNSHKKILNLTIMMLIPVWLIFLEPDSGVALMYIIIYFAVLFNIIKRKKYIFLLFSLFLVLGVSFISLYFLNDDLFIKLFGTSFFYRMDRLLDFKNNTSFQLSNALIGMGASGFTGLGLHSSKIYVPELTTDFSFCLTVINFGFMMGIALILVYTYILLKLFNLTGTRNLFYKYYSTSVFILMFYQILEHIFMNLGLTPITGITLPFMSYGGSSMISFFLIYGILLKITTNNSSYS